MDFEKRCWYSIGSPPPAVSKKDVLKFLSVKTIVIAPARTGKDNKSNTAVTNTAQPNKDNLCSLIPGLLMFNIVVMTIKLVNKFTNIWTISSAYYYIRCLMFSL